MRKAVISITGVLCFLILMAANMALSRSTVEHPNPTEQQQTLDAAIGQFFTQTAEVQQRVNATQTVAAAFSLAQTAAVNAQATAQAAFDQAQTATANAQATFEAGFQQAVRATAQAEIEPEARQLGRYPIRPFNASELQQLMRLGDGRISGVFWSPDDASLMTSLLNAFGGMEAGGLELAFGISYDLSGLHFETIEQTGTHATVNVGGEIVVSVLGLFQREELPTMPLPLSLEDGVWKVCDQS